MNKIGVGAVFKAALNMRRMDTIKEWGEKLMRQHRPEDLLALPDFMRPRESVHVRPREMPSVKSDLVIVTHEARQGVTYAMIEQMCRVHEGPSKCERGAMTNPEPVFHSDQRFMP